MLESNQDRDDSIWDINLDLERSGRFGRSTEQPHDHHHRVAPYEAALQQFKLDIFWIICVSLFRKESEQLPTSVDQVSLDPQFGACIS